MDVDHQPEVAVSTVKTCGYVNCICRDCMEVAVCGRPIGEKHRAEHHLCLECEEAGCDPSGDVGCQRTDTEEEE